MNINNGSEKQIVWATALLTNAINNLNERKLFIENQITKTIGKYQNDLDKATRRNAPKINEINNLDNRINFFKNANLNSTQIIEYRGALDEVVRCPNNIFEGHKRIFQK